MNDLGSILQQANLGVGSAEAANALARNVQMAAFVEALSRLGDAFDTYEPTLAAGTGTFTDAATFGHYLQFGSICFVNVGVDITTNGTAATSIYLGLPLTAKDYGTNRGQVMNGRRLATPIALMGIIDVTAGFDAVRVQSYDGTYPGLDGTRPTVQGWYEVEA